jgi:hypothetical protein
VARITRWNGEQLINKVASTLERMGPIYSEAATLQMSNPVWDWQWATLRKTSLLMGGTKESGKPGVIVGPGRRDIVDTGRLLDSITSPRVVRQNGTAALTIGWTAPYAKTVLAGGRYGSYVNVRGEFVNVGQRPARNWIQAAFESRPPAQLFAEIWKSAGRT